MKKFSILFCFVLFFVIKNISAQSDTMYINPNPFGDSTNIHIEFFQKDTVTLYIFNRLGENLRTPFKDSVLEKGKYRFVFKRDTLPDGIYIASLSYKSGKRISKTMTIKNGASVNQSGNIEFQIFPNPANQFLNVLANNKIQQISITDLNGKEIFKQNDHINTQITLQNFPAGIYILKIKTNTGNGIQKFIKE